MMDTFKLLVAIFLARPPPFYAQAARLSLAKFDATYISSRDGIEHEQ